MTPFELPDELARLEDALRRRRAPVPPAALRLRALGELHEARSRERGGLVAAAAAILVVVLGVRASMPGPAGSSAERRVDLAGLEASGLPADELRRAALTLSLARVPRIAPPMGSFDPSLLATPRH